MSFSWARFPACEILKKGTEKNAKNDARRIFLLDKSTAGTFSGAPLTGKVMAAVGQIAAHVSQ
jgi:hypothetical protein